MRRHNESIANLNESWWKEIVSHSIRDQLSFNYVLWRTGIECGTIPGNYFKNDFFPYTNHQKHIGEVSYRVTRNQADRAVLIETFETADDFTAITEGKQVELKVRRKENDLVIKLLGNDPCIILPFTRFPDNEMLLISVNITSRTNTVLKLFYLTQSCPEYFDGNSLSCSLKTGGNKVDFLIPHTGSDLKGPLRLNTAMQDGLIVVSSIRFFKVPIF